MVLDCARLPVGADADVVAASASASVATRGAVLLADAFTNVYLSIGEELRATVGHQFYKDGGGRRVAPQVPLKHKGMFRTCSFKGEDCLNAR